MHKSTKVEVYNMERMLEVIQMTQRKIRVKMVVTIYEINK